MQIKEYKLSKTAAKTAKENNLILAEEMYGGKLKRLFDFSLLDTMEIPDNEKEVLKEYALRYVRPSDNVSYYGKIFDRFSACDGIAGYYKHRVYSKDGRYLYDIFQLAKVKHDSKSCKSVYDEKYDVTTYEGSCGYSEPINDIEL